MFHSVKIPVPIFDKDFKIEGGYVYKGFEQHELNNLALRFHEKNLLGRRTKVSYFRLKLITFLQYF